MAYGAVVWVAQVLTSDGWGEKKEKTLQKHVPSGYTVEPLYILQTPIGQKKVSVLVKVSLFQMLHCERTVLGKEKVPLLERCPHFKERRSSVR